MSSYYEKFPDGRVVCVDEEIPFEIPEGWEWARIRNVSQSYIGLTYSPGDVASEGTVVLRSSNIKDGKLVLDDIVKVKCQISEKLYVEENDILICARNGSAKLVGKAAIIPHLNEKMSFGAFMAICKTPIYKFVYLFLQSDLFFSQLREVSGTTTINQLTQNNFNGFLIPIPPIDEQDRIVEKVSSIAPILEKYSKSQDALDHLNQTIKKELRSSILQEAIQGKLVPQNSEDEPAEKLLERINTEKHRLVKEGKLKAKDAVSSVIFKGEDNKYYEQIGDSIEPIDTELSFPETWAVCKLSTICQLTDGIKRTGPGVCLDAKYLRGKSAATILQNGKYVRTGDNIILVDGENSGEVFPVPENGYMGSTFKQLWISDTMCKAYVLHTIRFYKDALRNSKKGAAIPHLNKELFYNILIGIPPYQEQERISARIDELLDLLN
ncbi:MAG: restriction endonuclease subunit S [Bacteroidales bacterium]|nr:restriction endonuclease subunit S [Bacteroidales bacterium]